MSRTWRVPTRESLLPIDPDQSCAICGRAEVWAWACLLLSPPPWVMTRGWFPNWFVTMCTGCHEAWEAADTEFLQEVWSASTDNEDGARSFEEWSLVVRAMLSEPPLPREQIQAV